MCTHGQPHRHSGLSGRADLCLDGPTQAKITTATGTGKEPQTQMERCQHTGVKPTFRDTEDMLTHKHFHPYTCYGLAPGLHVYLCGGVVRHISKALTCDTCGDRPTYAFVSTVTHIHTATHSEVDTGLADSYQDTQTILNSYFCWV